MQLVSFSLLILLAGAESLLSTQAEGAGSVATLLGDSPRYDDHDQDTGLPISTATSAAVS